MRIESPDELRRLAPERVCVIKPSALGDIIQTLPILGALRHRWPGARVTWLANEAYAPILEGHPQIDELLLFRRRDNWWSPVAYARFLRLLRALRARRFDLVFDLQCLSRTALMSAATGAPVRIGMRTAREGASWACHTLLDGTEWDRPAYSRYWRVAEAIGAGDAPQRTNLPVAEAARRWAERALGELPGPVLAVHPGARWVTKRWPAERFAQVARHAVERRGLSVAILGGPGDAEAAARIERELDAAGAPGRSVNLAGRMGLGELAAVLERADALLTNDSGPMHMAAALGTPVLAVFLCTKAAISGPPGEAHELIETRVPCGGSYEKQCPHRGEDHLACMGELTAERVTAALDRLCERNTIGARNDAPAASGTEQRSGEPTAEDARSP